MTIKNRIKRLQSRMIADKKPMVILTYRDGKQQSMKWIAAFFEIATGADVVHVQCPDETGCSLLAAMLPNDGTPDYWDDLEEVK